MKERAAGFLSVIGQALPLARAFRWPLVALVLIMASFMGHTGLDYDIIWLVQFTAVIAFFLAINGGGGRQSFFALLVVFISIIVSFGISREVDRVGNVVIQLLLFGGFWLIANLASLAKKFSGGHGLLLRKTFSPLDSSKTWAWLMLPPADDWTDFMVMGSE